MTPPIRSSLVMPLRTESTNVSADCEKSVVATMPPPMMPKMSHATVRSGSVTSSAIRRGATSLRIGSVPKARIASICCETTIEPSSAEIAEPTRAVTISAARTGPSSRTSESATRYPVSSCAP